MHDAHPSPFPIERQVSQATPDKVQPRRDERVSALAAAEWGVLSLEELRQCGMNREAVRRRVCTGWLHPIYRSVYAVGHPAISRHGRFLAAVKSLGDDAVLSHFSAAAHWGFVDWDERHPEVTVRRAGVGRRANIRVHRTTALERRDVMRRNGIPVTSPARTLIDLAAVVNDKLLRTAVRRALARRRVSIRQLLATSRRLGRRRGSAKLTRVLANAAPTRSGLEDIVFDLIVDSGFVRPDVNRPLLLAGRRVIPDFRWPEQRVVVEADSRAWHDDPIARADDAERQALLEGHGERVLRVTWRQAATKPEETVARLTDAGAPRSRGNRGHRKASSSGHA